MGDPGAEQRNRFAGVARSRRGLVAAAVDATGRPAGLKIIPAALSLPVEELAAELLGTMQAAHDAAMASLDERLSGSAAIETQAIDETMRRLQAEIDRQARLAAEELDEVRRRLGRLAEGGGAE